MKHRAPQAEIRWTEPEGFALVPERAVDWAARQAEADKRAKDRDESEKKQKGLFE